MHVCPAPSLHAMQIVHAQLPDLSKALHVSKVMGAAGMKEVARWLEQRRAATTPKFLVADVADEEDLTALMRAVAGVCERVRTRRHILSVDGACGGVAAREGGRHGSVCLQASCKTQQVSGMWPTHYSCCPHVCVPTVVVLVVWSCLAAYIGCHLWLEEGWQAGWWGASRSTSPEPPPPSPDLPAFLIRGACSCHTSPSGLAEVDLVAVPLPTSAQDQATRGVQGAPGAPLVVALAWVRRVPHQLRWNRVCRQLPMAPIEITASNGWAVLSGLPDLMIAALSRVRQRAWGVELGRVLFCDAASCAHEQAYALRGPIATVAFQPCQWPSAWACGCAARWSRPHHSCPVMRCT